MVWPVEYRDEEALDIILRGAEGIDQVSEQEIAAAMRAYFSDTHNIAEGASATALAALLKHRDRHGRAEGRTDPLRREYRSRSLPGDPGGTTPVELEFTRVERRVD